MSCLVEGMSNSCYYTCGGQVDVGGKIEECGGNDLERMIDNEALNDHRRSDMNSRNATAGSRSVCSREALLSWNLGTADTI